MSFLINPAVERFAGNELNTLRTRLQEVDRKETRIVPRVGFEDLALLPGGRTRAGMAYTTASFRQVCGFLGPGLFPLVVDLAASDKGKTARASQGIEVFNLILRYRFEECLSDQYRLMLNPHLKRIEGVLPPTYNLFDNSAVLELAQNLISGQRSWKFHEALLHGRLFQARFHQTEPLATVRRGDKEQVYYDGAGFRNSEMTGQSSLHISRLIVRETDGSAILVTIPSVSRMAHVGNQFAQRVTRLFTQVMGADTDRSTIRKQLETLRDTPLSIPVDPDGRKRWIDDLAHRIQRWHLSSRAAAKLAASVLTSSNGRPRQLDQVARLSGLDLLHTLMSQARDYEPCVQARIETAAHGILSGRIALSGRTRRPKTSESSNPRHRGL
jgi:hypothetical protein